MGWLPDGCTQDALDHYLDGEEPPPCEGEDRIGRLRDRQEMAQRSLAATLIDTHPDLDIEGLQDLAQTTVMEYGLDDAAYDAICREIASLKEIS